MRFGIPKINISRLGMPMAMACAGRYGMMLALKASYFLDFRHKKDVRGRP
jgi:hypothetical protein